MVQQQPWKEETDVIILMSLQQHICCEYS